ncbi:MAG: hypothetical protein R3Y54_08695 [Eubacteriales bacterium]
MDNHIGFNKILKQIKIGTILNKPIVNHIHSSNIEKFKPRRRIKIRKKLFRIGKIILQKQLKKENIILRRANLEKDKSYIFAPTHSFDEDLLTSVTTVDRTAYLVVGMTEQIKHNPQLYMAYIFTGMLHMFKKERASVEDLKKRMKKVLEEGGSYIIYPEGGFNNSQNQIIYKLGASIFFTSKETNTPVVPIISYSRYDYDKIYTIIGEPMSTEKYAYDEHNKFLTDLRDYMATEMWHLWEDYAPKVRRSEIGSVEDYYSERMHEYFTGIYDPRNHNWIEEEIIAYSEFEQENNEMFKEYLKENWVEAQNHYRMKK